MTSIKTKSSTMLLCAVKMPFFRTVYMCYIIESLVLLADPPVTITNVSWYLECFKWYSMCMA